MRSACRSTDLDVRRQIVTVDHFARPEDFRDYFKAGYGPTISVYRNIADDPDRTAILDDELAALARKFNRGNDTAVLDWEYLLITAQKLRELLTPPDAVGGVKSETLASD